MTYVITQPCCNDAACVPVCPMDCIHPGPQEAGFADADMLYIDPEACIDCGACVEVCPVDAIRPDTELTAGDGTFAALNRRFFLAHPAVWSEPLPPAAPVRMGGHAPLRVAIVGSGPSGIYAAEALMDRPGLDVEITVLERLDETGGLSRFGVAPDHARTRKALNGFRSALERPEIVLETGIEVGRDVTHDELIAHHDAVIYSVGAASHRSVGLPGEALPGSHPASDFVRWYNGHPDATDLSFDLSHERVAVIGNGNVALDVARMLLKGADELATLDLWAPARQVLAASRVREVMVIGRRGPSEMACTLPELVELAHLAGVDVLVHPLDVQPDLNEMPGAPALPDDFSARLKEETIGVYTDATRGHDRALVLRFHASPTAILGDRAVSGLRVRNNAWSANGDGSWSVGGSGEQDDIDCGLVLTAVGHRAERMAALPFDPVKAVVPNHRGRVLSEDGNALPRTYVTGWIKRGPSGGIGVNKHCSAETVESLVQDFFADIDCRPAEYGADGRARFDFADLLAARRRHSASRR